MKLFPWFRFAVGGGLIAGSIYIIVQIFLFPLVLDISAWSAFRIKAALVLNPIQVLSPPADFEIGIISTAVIVHLTLSVLFSIPFGLFLKKVHSGAIFAGVVYGIILYMINFYLLTYAFHWFADFRNWVTLLSHLLFGLTLGIFAKNEIKRFNKLLEKDSQ